ncbi:hypothetical protein [Streptomyces sp. CRN 30]|uniref:hypothetical protein n=1 Tax=Streptomyces sp. CRN 30 TaxID=3075613 RepID=UPI002A82815E|nr:hypothetical protein [Streptomyces sp. CRN 30]
MPPSPPPSGPADAAGTFDEALDDAELVCARAALAGGRWQTARSLLAHTGDDWDRRGHRVTVLAREPCAAALARDWLLTEPGSADAHVLLALALVRAALRGGADPETARDACRTAAEQAPADPTPWLGTLMLERVSGTDKEAVYAFEEVRGRYADHHHAHHLIVARLAERRADAGPDPLHEVYEFADRAAATAPADSPLAVLPVVAHTERHRVLAAAGHGSADPAARGHWSGQRAALVLRAAFDWWLEWEQDGHPRGPIDLNFLAHAASRAGHGAEAAALFRRIGDHVTPQPWSYSGHDPRTAFAAARAAALGPWN